MFAVAAQVVLAASLCDIDNDFVRIDMSTPLHDIILELGSALQVCHVWVETRRLNITGVITLVYHSFVFA